MRILVLVVALCLTGCAPSNLAEAIKAQGASVRSSYGRMTTIYGSAVICGSGAVNVRITCNAEGMTIQSLTEVEKAIAVPVTIKPIELVPGTAKP